MTISKFGQPAISDDPFSRARCRAVARAAVAHELGLEPQFVDSRSDGCPYLVLRVSETVRQENRVQDWLTVYYGGVEAEKALYGSYTGDGTGEIEDLAHEFHLDKKHLL